MDGVKGSTHSHHFGVHHLGQRYRQLSAGLKTSGTDTLGQLGAASGRANYRQREETSGQSEEWLVARVMWS